MQLSIHTRNNTFYSLIALLMEFIIPAFSSQAQTFTRQTMQTLAPVSLRVIIKALNQLPILRIRYENQDKGVVRIQIRDSRGSVLCDEQKQQQTYAGEFDMSGLLAGVYCVELQTNQAHYQETVRVELLDNRYPIVVTNLAKQPDYGLSRNERVIHQLSQ